MRFPVHVLRTALSSAAVLLMLVCTTGAPAQQKLVSCKPVSQRTQPEGCWIAAHKDVGKLSDAPVFWTLDVYPTREEADQAKTANGEVVEALGKIWLFTVGDKPKEPTHGSRITQIGPLPVKPGEEYSAQYMEAILEPGSVSGTHMHPGPEAFYTESGETCLETPAGKQVGERGRNIITTEGEPMELTATGTETRRGLVLVLHSSSKPAITVVDTWKSKGLCKKALP